MKWSRWRGVIFLTVGEALIELDLVLWGWLELP